MDDVAVNNKTSKIHRNRRGGSCSKGNDMVEVQRSIDSGKSRRRTVSLLEIKTLEHDHSNIPLSDRSRREYVGESLIETDQTINSARRKRRERHRQKATIRNSRKDTVITAVIGDLIEEESHSSAKILGDDNVLVENWEFSLGPPKMNNISYKQYVEQQRNKKFSPCDLDDMGVEGYNNSPRNTHSPINVAIAVQKCCRPLSALFCGFLGGLSLWPCLTMLHWNSPYRESFMKYYPDCARVFQCLYYLFAVISLVSVLDSCDLSQLEKRNFWYSLPTRPAPLLIGFTLMVSLTVSLICSPLDDKLSLAVNNDWNFEHNVTSILVDWDLEWWVTINYIRCIGAVLTWVLFSLCLGPDALWNHLVSLLEISKKNDKDLIENK